MDDVQIVDTKVEEFTDKDWNKIEILYVKKSNNKLSYQIHQHNGCWDDCTKIILSPFKQEFDTFEECKSTAEIQIKWL